MYRKWAIRDPSDWTSTDISAWLGTWQAREIDTTTVGSLTGARMLQFRTMEDLHLISRDVTVRSLLLKRLHELRKVSRRIKRQQQQLQAMLTQELNDLRLANANARAKAVAEKAKKEEEERTRAAAGSEGGEGITTEAAPDTVAAAKE